MWCTLVLSCLHVGLMDSLSLALSLCLSLCLSLSLSLSLFPSLSGSAYRSVSKRILCFPLRHLALSSSQQHWGVTAIEDEHPGGRQCSVAHVSTAVASTQGRGVTSERVRVYVCVDCMGAMPMSTRTKSRFPLRGKYRRR